MNLSRRIRYIYETQVRALKDRLDRIDAEDTFEGVDRRRYEADARQELADAMRSPEGAAPNLRTPDEIARGALRSDAGPAEPAAPRPTPPAQAAPPVSPLGKHYRVLGLEDGADLSSIKSAYTRQAARCAPERFPEGSEERTIAEEIRQRVDAAYDALRDALDPTAGRFDKLELE